MARDGRSTRLGASCAVAGALLLVVGTYLHPGDADPNDAIAAFTEYAADRLWVASHLAQLGGMIGLVAALLCLARELESGRAAAWARLAASGAVASLAIAAALQAVDGIALKRVVDAWAAAPPDERHAAFYAAFAVRQIETGLASVLSLVLGLSVTVFAVAMLVDATEPRWLGAIAIMGGVATTVAGGVIAYTGFSAAAMVLDMPAGALLVAWMLAVGVRLWRRVPTARSDSSR